MRMHYVTLKHYYTIALACRACGGGGGGGGGRLINDPCSASADRQSKQQELLTVACACGRLASSPGRQFKFTAWYMLVRMR